MQKAGLRGVSNTWEDSLGGIETNVQKDIWK